MTVPPPLPAKTQSRDAGQAGRQTVSIRAVSPPSTTPLTMGAGATVFVGVGAPAGDSAAACRRRIPEVRPSNGYEALSEGRQQCQQAAHVVKIRINPDGEKNGRVISTVRLTLDEDGTARERLGKGAVSATDLVSEERCGSGEACVRISVLGSEGRKDMVQRGGGQEAGLGPVPLNGGRSSTCFYYDSYGPAGMVMSSGQCSPSDTLDSGTCSDLDGTPPPLPKKKSASTVTLSSAQHDRAGSLTSSGAEVDSDDNESNISCDSLNGREFNGEGREDREEFAEDSMVERLEKSRDASCRTMGEEKKDVEEHREALINETWDSCSARACSRSVSPSPSGTSSLSKASSTPRVRSPDSLAEQNGRLLSPVVKECTYEERKQEQERVEQESTAVEQNGDRPNGTKYVYEDDRFYKFHVNELRGNNKDSSRGVGAGNEESDECFAGYKILEKEAIRSAKGTVRGVKNRVRAGIATFLQEPSSKAYVEKEKGRVVVYTTTSGIVRETFYNCMKVKQILRTHMVKYEEGDLFGNTELQVQLRERLGTPVIRLPQLFIDGQYIGEVDKVEELNESGDLRRMLKPYQSDDACATCLFCGGHQWLLCPTCNGSKRSVHCNDFTAEFVALKCARCDPNGLIRCTYC
ncbi:hypothetical protein KM043_013681 [Ampulex compressa]|nr:hypothetical protein KM043_013681 [Ampulex compressa]